MKTFRLLAVIFLTTLMAGCKVDLNLTSWGGISHVVSQSGTFDCTITEVGPLTFTQGGDCVEEYVTAYDQCSMYDAEHPTVQPPNCTLIGQNSYVEENLFAETTDGGVFSGWAGMPCVGSGVCQFSVYDTMTDDSDQTITAWFGTEATPQDATYTYDAYNRRESKTVNEITTYFIYDQYNNLISELDQAGTPLYEYIYLNGERVAQYDYTQDPENPVLTYYVNDHLGQPLYMVNTNGDMVYELADTPFGEVYGEYKLPNVMEEQPHRLPGQYADKETGYYYNMNRYYMAEGDRYLQSDPIGQAGGINTYLYANANPVMFTDRTGLCPICIAAIVWGLENAVAINTIGIAVAEIGAGTSLVVGESMAARTIATEMNAIQTFNNFNAAKKALGSIPGRDIHHVVEQCQAYPTRSGFALSEINSTNNLIRLDEDVHQAVSNFYGGRAPGGGRIRDTLNGISFKEQFDFGMDVVERAINGTL